MAKDDYARYLQRYAEHYRRYRGGEPPKPMVVIFNASHDDPDTAAQLFEQVVAYYRSTIDHYGFADSAMASIPGYEYYGKMSEKIQQYGALLFGAVAVFAGALIIFI